MNGDSSTPPILTTLEQSRAYVAAGLSLLPITTDGKKRPAIARWKHLQQRQPKEAELLQWFTKRQLGVGIIAGAVSGGLEILDIDDGTLWEPFQEIVREESPALLHRLVVVETPRPGRHIYYRCAETEGSRKLAWRLATAEELREDPEQQTIGLIETRAE